MFRLSAIALVLLLSSQSDSGINRFWQLAAESYGRSSSYGAGRTIMLIEELDAKGAVISRERGETVSVWNGPEPTVTVIRAEKNGKDVADEWRKRMKGGGQAGGGPPPGFDASPFGVEYAPSLSVGAPKTGPDGIQVPYEIKAKNAEVGGTVQFDTGGKVLSARQKWVKMPMFVTAIESEFRYEYVGDALVIAGMTIRIDAGLLMITKHYRMDFTFADWKLKRGSD